MQVYQKNFDYLSNHLLMIAMNLKNLKKAIIVYLDHLLSNVAIFWEHQYKHEFQVTKIEEPKIDQQLEYKRIIDNEYNNEYVCEGDYEDSELSSLVNRDFMLFLFSFSKDVS